MRNLADIVELDLPPDAPPRAVEILRAASRLFATRGFAETSMRDIAAATGLSKATLYHYFPSKDAILRPLVMGTIKSIHERALACADPGAPAPERLRAFMEESAAFFEEFRWAWIAGSDLFWSDPKPAQRRERLRWRDGYEHHLRGILADGVAQGGLHVPDVAMAGRLVLSCLNWLPRWFKPDGPLSARAIAGQFCDQLLAGFALAGAGGAAGSATAITPRGTAGVTTKAASARPRRRAAGAGR